MIARIVMLVAAGASLLACGGDSSGPDFPFASIYALEWSCEGQCSNTSAYTGYDKMEISAGEGDGFKVVFIGASCAAANLVCQLDTAPCPEDDSEAVDVLACSPLPACGAGAEQLSGLTFCRGRTESELDAGPVSVGDPGSGGQTTFRLHAVVRSL
ncbi:MAG TPA: hypothetical protein VKB80_16315 [Kofleriaceae bacterium]|nr:hypothetical protein [Kofleriaceae bacterium]